MLSLNPWCLVVCVLLMGARIGLKCSELVFVPDFPSAPLLKHSTFILRSSVGSRAPVWVGRPPGAGRGPPERERPVRDQFLEERALVKSALLSRDRRFLFERPSVHLSIQMLLTLRGHKKPTAHSQGPLRLNTAECPIVLSLSSSPVAYSQGPLSRW